MIALAVINKQKKHMDLIFDFLIRTFFWRGGGGLWRVPLGALLLGFGVVFINLGFICSDRQ